MSRNIDLKKKRRSKRQDPVSDVTKFTGSIKGDSFFINQIKPNGEEDVARIVGLIKPQESYLSIEVGLRLTGSWLVSIAGSIVIAIIAAYMYTFIGWRLFDHTITNAAMPYLLLIVTAIYINLRYYSNKATGLIEEMVFWLELEPY